ncbi:hypothetical protein [Calidifontibacillus oryziterrae]|uniref:hypothetical protein n=1 Tax=Calidifontibacillus oryziterrae TaxID=1191699 RepID=UPI0002FC2E91|nr:hypothetical protein [Calidifontibacillus oryziterrae]
MNYVFAIIVAFVINFIMNYLQFNSVIILIVTFLIVLAGLLYPTYRTLLSETKVEKVEKFLLKKRKMPTYAFIYALANNDEEEALAALNKLLKINKQTHKQALFKTMYHLYKKDLAAVKEEIEYIKPELYKNYYKTALLVEEGEFSEARQLASQITKRWMQHALFAEIEKEEDNCAEAARFAKLALAEAKGLNRYSLYKAYERDFPEVI